VSHGGISQQIDCLLELVTILDFARMGGRIGESLDRLAERIEAGRNIRRRRSSGGQWYLVVPDDRDGLAAVPTQAQDSYGTDSRAEAQTN
jgi:hypothetical protein